MMSYETRVHAAPGAWVVRAGGAVIAESRAALELTEGDLPPEIYFPEKDVAMALLEPSGTVLDSPRKGRSRCFHFAGADGRLSNAAWMLEAPAGHLAQLAGHLAFDGSKVAVERL